LPLVTPVTPQSAAALAGAGIATLSEVINAQASSIA
jgi:hypothetical protein